MKTVFLANTILDRLPMSLSGVSYNDFSLIGLVCPKLNKSLKRSE